MSKISLINPDAKFNVTKSRDIIAEVELTSEIILNSPWSPLLMHTKELKGANFKQVSILAFDIDNKDGHPQLSLKDAIEMFKNYKVIIAPTKSHQVWKDGQSPRDKYRIILFFSYPITDGEQYKQNYEFFNSQFFTPKTADNVGDLGRFFYASSSIAYINDNGIILDVIPLKNNIKLPIKAIVDRKGKLTATSIKLLSKTQKITEWHNQTLRLMTDMKDKGYDIDEVRDRVSELGWQNWDSKDETRLQSVFKNPKTYFSNKEQSKETMLTTLLEELHLYLQDKLLIYEDPKGDTTPVKKISNTIVSNVSINACIDMVVNRAHEIGLPIMKDTAEKIFNTWVATTSNTGFRIQKLPPAFSMDPEEMTYNFVRLSLKDGPTPVWDDFISRCGANGKALMAYTWSLFEKDKPTHQYLFLRGPGGDGKSSYTEWIQQIVGDSAYCALDPNDKQWAAQCVGKRVGFWPELNNTRFVMNSNFKQITASEATTITQKYEKSYTAILDIKFILVTNQSIEISGDLSQKRRIILIDLSENKNFIPNYKQKIKEETNAFLFKCKQAFNELYDTSTKMIKCDYEKYESHSSNFEDDFSVVWEKAFKYTPGNKVRSVEITEAINIASRTPNYRFRIDMANWMERTKGITKKKSNGIIWYENVELINKTSLSQGVEECKLNSHYQ